MKAMWRRKVLQKCSIHVPRNLSEQPYVKIATMGVKLSKDNVGVIFWSTFGSIIKALFF